MLQRWGDPDGGRGGFSDAHVPCGSVRANSRCGNFEGAALYELVAQLVEQRPFNPNLTENRRLDETSL